MSCYWYCCLQFLHFTASGLYSNVVQYSNTFFSMILCQSVEHKRAISEMSQSVYSFTFACLSVQSIENSCLSEEFSLVLQCADTGCFSQGFFINRLNHISFL